MKPNQNNNVMFVISLNIVGCSRTVNSGYSQDQWDALSDDEKLEAETQALWETVTVRIKE